MTFEYLIQAGQSGPGRDARDARAGQPQRRIVVEPKGGDRFCVTVYDAQGAQAERREVVLSARRVAGESEGAAARATATTWSLLYGEEGGVQRVVDVDGTLPDLKVTVAGGDPISLKLMDARSREALLGESEAGSGGGPANAARELRAAMPGKVVKLLCKVGDVVKAGQGLLVIEAMKMENELRAAAAGQVTELAVREGQTVDGGQRLVLLSPVAAGT